MKYYKLSKNFRCVNLTYEVGKTYKLEGELTPCKSGFHFCENLDDLFDYYPFSDVIDKSDTNELEVLREVPKSEWNGMILIIT